MTGLAAWWRGRSRRERTLLLVLGGLFLLVLLWLLVVRPVGDRLSAARERHGEAVVALAEAKAQAAAIVRLERGRPAALTGAVDGDVAAAASAAGFQLSRIEADGLDRATLAIEAARPQALFAWVAEMETAKGLIVERLTATANSDKSLSVRITLRRRGVAGGG
jgi:general secretion pathway protein M